MTLHGVTREITFPMRRVGKEGLGDPWGNLRAGFEGGFTIHRADFGIAGNGRFSELADFAIGPDVEVTLRIQAVLWNVARWTTDEKSVVRALQPVLDAKGAEAAVAEYHRLKREEADKWIFPEGSLSLLGHRLLQSRRPAEGLAMLALNAEAYPQSTRVWVDLARARAVNGDLAGAAAAVRKALALDEHDTMAAMLLSKLEPATARRAVAVAPAVRRTASCRDCRRYRALNAATATRTPPPWPPRRACRRGCSSPSSPTGSPSRSSRPCWRGRRRGTRCRR